MDNSNFACEGSLQAVLGASVEVICDAGYSGGGTASCGSDGSFNSLPTCVAVSCASTEVTNSDYAATSSISGSTGDTVLVTCDVGYEGGGNTTCRADAYGVSFTNSVSCLSRPLAASYQKIGEKTGYFSAFLDNSDYFGASVAALGDVNGDSVTDLLAGAYGDDDGESSSGAVYVLFLETTGHVSSFQKISATAGSLTAALAASDYFGFAVCELTGLNNDAYVDVAVGAYGDDDGGSSSGAVYILALTAAGEVHSFSKISSLVGSFTAVVTSSDYFGISVASAGDLDGDSVTDLLVGASSDDNGYSNAGSLYILKLNSTGSSVSHRKISATTGWFTALMGSSDYFGRSSCSIDDLNSDGNRELVVGAPGNNDGGYDRGAVYVLWPMFRFTTFELYVLSQQKISSSSGSFTGSLSDSDQFGVSNTFLGDLNGDGYSDIMTGAYGGDDVASAAGAVFVIFLTATGCSLSHQKLSASAGGYTFDLSSSDYFGSSVSYLGDLNGDLIPDYAIGSYKDAIAGHYDTGSVYVVFGAGGEAFISLYVCMFVCLCVCVFCVVAV